MLALPGFWTSLRIRHREMQQLHFRLREAAWEQQLGACKKYCNLWARRNQYWAPGMSSWDCLGELDTIHFCIKWNVHHSLTELFQRPLWPRFSCKERVRRAQRPQTNVVTEWPHLWGCLHQHSSSLVSFETSNGKLYRDLCMAPNSLLKSYK